MYIYVYACECVLLTYEIKKGNAKYQFRNSKNNFSNVSIHFNQFIVLEMPVV